MNMITLPLVICFILTLSGITALGIYSGKQVKDTADFIAGGRKTCATIVVGTIMGTIVGGSSTVGTAELAYTYGFSAIWFSLGSGIGCLVLALLFTKPMRRSKCSTIQQMISQEYGNTAGILSSILGCLGIFINIVAQVLAATALLQAMFPVSPIVGAIIGAILMAFSVIFGGVWGAGMVGIVKTVLLYISVISGGILALKLGGGMGELQTLLPQEQYFNLFARGIGIDLGAGLSLVFGVLSTQTYIQAVLSARSDKTAIKGALISAFITVPIGLGSVLVGLFMKIQYPNLDPSQAFPQFVINHIPPLFGGVVLAALFLAILGTGAGLTLGVSTVLNNDIYKSFSSSYDDKKSLRFTRLSIVTILVVAILFTTGSLQSVILQWSFMSMALRAAVTFFPMCGSLFASQRIHRRFIIPTIIVGPLGVLFGSLLLNVNFDTLFIGMGISFIFMVAGYIVQHIHKSTSTKDFHKSNNQL